MSHEILNGDELSLLPFNPEGLLSKSPYLLGVESVALPTTLSLWLKVDTGRLVILYQGKLLYKSRKFNHCEMCGISTVRHILCKDCYQKIRDVRYRLSCALCGTEFTRLRGEVEKSLAAGSVDQYCSLECSQNHHAVKNRRICKTCGQPTKTKTSHYCAACWVERRKATRKLAEQTCPYCGVEFRPKSRRTRYCSNECADFAHSSRMRGKANSNYKDGKSYADWFQKMRPIILERDGQACSVCGAGNIRKEFKRLDVVQVRSTLVIHHIDENTANNVAENLITICHNCHISHHKTMSGGKPSPFPQLSDLAKSRSESMTSKLREIATSLQTVYSSTTVD